MGKIEVLCDPDSDIGPRYPIVGARCYGRDDLDDLTPVFMFLHVIPFPKRLSIFRSSRRCQ
jgi:hypothetical protein